MTSTPKPRSRVTPYENRELEPRHRDAPAGQATRGEAPAAEKCSCNPSEHCNKNCVCGGNHAKPSSGPTAEGKSAVQIIQSAKDKGFFDPPMRPDPPTLIGPTSEAGPSTEAKGETREPCIHAVPQSASQLHGICVFCYRDRLGATASALAAAEAKLFEMTADRDSWLEQTEHARDLALKLGDEKDSAEAKLREEHERGYHEAVDAMQPRFVQQEATIAALREKLEEAGTNTELAREEEQKFWSTSRRMWINRANEFKAENEALRERVSRLEDVVKSIAECPDGGCKTCNEEAKLLLAALAEQEKE